MATEFNCVRGFMPTVYTICGAWWPIFTKVYIPSVRAEREG